MDVRGKGRLRGDVGGNRLPWVVFRGNESPWMDVRGKGSTVSGFKGQWDALDGCD